MVTNSQLEHDKLAKDVDIQETKTKTQETPFVIEWYCPGFYFLITPNNPILNEYIKNEFFPVLQQMSIFEIGKTDEQEKQDDNHKGKN